MADTKNPIEITAKDLPLFCPSAHAPSWSMHPRVFLDISHAPDHRVSCPYCSATYQLKAGEKLHSH